MKQLTQDEFDALGDGDEGKNIGVQALNVRNTPTEILDRL